jgi:hypothetical protein
LYTKITKRNWKTLITGKVFFNYFIAVTTKLRPSTLLKAWNRGAAIISESQTEGIDFVIPVVVKNAAKKVMASFGRLFGEWTKEQEMGANAVIGYILIQTKNRKEAPASKWSMGDCILNEKNLLNHHPSNPFISILMELGVGDPKSSPVDLRSEHTNVCMDMETWNGC